jgi:hypothetical protein
LRIPYFRQVMFALASPFGRGAGGEGKNLSKNWDASFQMVCLFTSCCTGIIFEKQISNKYTYTFTQQLLTFLNQHLEHIPKFKESEVYKLNPKARYEAYFTSVSKPERSIVLTPDS